MLCDMWFCNRSLICQVHLVGEYILNNVIPISRLAESNFASYVESLTGIFRFQVNDSQTLFVGYLGIRGLLQVLTNICFNMHAQLFGPT